MRKDAGTNCRSVVGLPKKPLLYHGPRFVIILEKFVMIEKQSINNKDVWIKVDPHPVERSNPNIFPTEYFTASYYLNEPTSDNSIAILMKDEEGQVKLFESPVAALSFASKKLESIVS
jgi:hypothetical protein